MSDCGVFSVMKSSMTIGNGWFRKYSAISIRSNWALISVELGESSLYQAEIAVFWSIPCVTFERRPEFSPEHWCR